LMNVASAPLRAFQVEHLLDHGSCLRGSMLPSVTALVHASPSGVFGWGVRHGVDPLLIASVLHRLNALGGVPPNSIPFSGGGKCKLPWRERSEGKPPVSLFMRASRPRLVFPTTSTSADFSPSCDGEISPGNCTLLLRTAAEFTSTGIPDDFGVLCPLIAPCRPFIRFLSIGSRI
jgi:hypothetical protein